MKRTSLIGLFGGLLAGVLIWNLPLSDLGIDGQKCLALSLTVVIWWATKAVPTGYASLALLLGYALLLDPELVPLSAVFGLWTSPTIYLVIGGFLIAHGVQASGLGKRLALLFIKRMVHSWRDVIISCYVLGILLSLIIPHPWPRCFLLLSVMSHIVQATGLEKRHIANVGLAIFSSSVPTAMIFLTGDSTLNPTVSGFAGASISWLQWFQYMGPPGILTSILTCTAHLALFQKPGHFVLEQDHIQQQIEEMGPVAPSEKKCMVVLAGAMIGWVTDSLHGIHPGWVAILAVLILSLPFVGVLDNTSWGAINLGTLFFLCAALAIGNVGKITGMSSWVVSMLLPEQMAANPYLFALVACALCMLVHMVLGSTMAVLGIVAPAIISLGAMAGLSPVVSALIAYTAVAGHWLLPFHHMNLLVGQENGGYSDQQVLRLGIPQTVIICITCLFEVFWWKLIGLI